MTQSIFDDTEVKQVVSTSSDDDSIFNDKEIQHSVINDVAEPSGFNGFEYIGKDIKNKAENFKLDPVKFSKDFVIGFGQGAFETGKDVVNTMLNPLSEKFLMRQVYTPKKDYPSLEEYKKENYEGGKNAWQSVSTAKGAGATLGGIAVLGGIGKGVPKVFKGVDAKLPTSEATEIGEPMKADATDFVQKLIDSNTEKMPITPEEYANIPDEYKSQYEPTNDLFSDKTIEGSVKTDKEITKYEWDKMQESDEPIKYGLSDKVSKKISDLNQQIEFLKEHKSTLEKEGTDTVQINKMLEDMTSERENLFTEANPYSNVLFDKEQPKLSENIKEFGAKIFAPISTELKEINPSLKYALREFEFKHALEENNMAKAVEPFLRGAKKMPKEDYAILDLALKNRDTAAADYILSKNNLAKEFGEVRNVLNDIHKRAKDAGLDLEYLQEYYPRKITHPNKFLEHLSKTELWSAIKDYLNKIDPENLLNESEKAEAVNDLLRGYGKDKINLSRPGYTKERTVEDITPELNKYYKDSVSALADYISTMNLAIESRKFFGKTGDVKNIDKSIGAYVNKLIEENLITAKDEQKVKNLLTDRFNQRGPNGIVGTFKNAGYITTMGSPISAITQIGDFTWTLVGNGFFRSVEGFSKLFSKDKITKQDLGIDKIAMEFSDQTNSAKAVSKVFKAVGLDFMDSIGKETYINASYSKFKKLAQKPTKEFTELLNQIYGDEAEQTVSDLKNGVFSENVKLLLFNDIADFQPIALSEMPRGYLTGGNGRVWYMLKTYTIKQFDIYRNEVFMKMKTDPIKATQNLIKISTCLMLCNTTADVLKDFLLGREINLGDTAVDNMLKLVGFSKWQLKKSKKDGLLETTLESILPPIPLLDSLYKDLNRKSKKEFRDFKVLNEIPLFGKFYYWWFGGGSPEGEERTKEATKKYRKEHPSKGKKKKHKTY